MAVFWGWGTAARGARASRLLPNSEARALAYRLGSRLYARAVRVTCYQTPTLERAMLLSMVSLTDGPPRSDIDSDR